VRQVQLQIGGVNGRLFPKPKIKVVEHVGYLSDSMAEKMLRTYVKHLADKADIFLPFDQIQTLDKVVVKEL
jgi:hypothetical protein